MRRITHADLYRFLLFKARPLWLQVCYFVSASATGFFILKILPMRHPAKPRPADLDLFFMSVSANTESSMDTVEMEEFSNLQLATLTILMLAGGEVFVSMLGLHFSLARSRMSAGTTQANPVLSRTDDAGDQGYKSTRLLFHVVLGYLLVVHAVGFALVLAYVHLVPDAGDVLRSKRLNASMFAIFTTVSSLANCGFVPTSENMVPFKACSGLLLLMAAQVLVGNTMYPPCLWLVLWALTRITGRREYGHILRERPAGYEHLFPGPRAASIGVTTLSLLALQVVVFCPMEWTSAGLTGLSPYRKIVAGVFLSVNSRYSGESVVDLGAVSPAVLVLFVVMMYLPPYIYFWPGNEKSDEMKKRKNLGLNLLSPLAYVAVFTIIICITERRHIAEDPLNFSVLNIVLEIVSAYGSVGFTTGYSCKRQLKVDTQCKDLAAGFSSRWSSSGKLVLIAVMLFGRMKKFSMEGGRSWKFTSSIHSGESLQNRVGGAASGGCSTAAAREEVDAHCLEVTSSRQEIQEV